jgi:hypothetical protein
MFPTSRPLKPGQKLINLSKMPKFKDIKPGQHMIDLSKMPKFSSNIDSNLVLDFQSISLKD